MSQVTKVLLDLTQRRNFYAGDLLLSVEILRNVTDTFKRASYEPSSDDVQVGVANGRPFRKINILKCQNPKHKQDLATSTTSGRIKHSSRENIGCSLHFVDL